MYKINKLPLCTIMYTRYRKGDLDYEKFDQYTKDEKYFVTRLKHNAVVTEVEDLKISYSYERLLDVGTKIICDKIVKLGSKYTYQTKQEYRLIKIVDKTGKENFFKWIKQNLKFKTFVGRSLNTVMIQIITGIMTFAIFKLIEPLIETKTKLIEIKRVIKANLFEIYEADQFNWSYIFNSS